MRAFLFAGLLLTTAGCLDFDAARQTCNTTGRCITMFEAPTLSSTVPENQATGVSPMTGISVSFSKPMDRASVTRPTISPPVVLSELQWSEDDTSFVVQPLVALAFATTYTVSLSGRSSEGGTLAAGTSFSFRTLEAPDTTAPTLTSSTPSNGLMGVDPTTRLSLSFSEPMRVESLDVTPAPLVGLGNPVWDADGRTVTFTMPLDDWQPMTTFVISINASDLAGNALSGSRSVSFKTAAMVVLDTTPPTVIATTPTPDAGNVDVKVNLGVTFSEPVQPAGATLTVSPNANCTPQLDATNTRLTCNNLTDLQADVQYVVTVPTTVKDLAGNALAQPFAYQFKTGLVPDTTRPTVVSATPLDGGVGAAINQQIQIKFSEPMDQAATQAAFAFIAPQNETATFSWSADGLMLTATPVQTLPYGQLVRWQVGAGAADLAGNTLLTLQQYSFTVRRSVTLDMVPLLTGYTANGTYLSPALYVGDSSNNQALLGFLVYQFPADAIEILNGGLALYQTATNFPFRANSGAQLEIYLEGIPYTAPLGADEATADAFCLGNTLQCARSIPSSSLCPGTVGFSTSATSANEVRSTLFSTTFPLMLSLGLQQRNRTFAIRVRRGLLPSATPGCGPFSSDADSVADYVTFGNMTAPTANRPLLSITYTAP